METLEDLINRTKVVIETRDDGLTVYHWRYGGPSTMCGLDYSYLGLPLRPLPEADGYPLCESCKDIVLKIERGWGG